MSNDIYNALAQGLREGLQVQSIYGIQVNDGPWDFAANTVTTQGMNHLLDVGFRNQTQTPTWYLAPFAGNVTPAITWTAADFDTNATEFVNYTQAARPALVPAAAASGEISNLASLASITVGALTGAENTTIWGVGLLSTSGKESGSGVLFSAARLGAQRANLQEDDIINLSWRLQVSNPA